MIFHDLHHLLLGDASQAPKSIKDSITSVVTDGTYLPLTDAEKKSKNLLANGYIKCNSFYEETNKFLELKAMLCGDISDVAKDTSKDLLERVVDSNRSLENKIKLLELIFGSNGDSYASNDPDKDILNYCLSEKESANKDDYIEIALYLIKNKHKYNNSYRFNSNITSSMEECTHILFMTNSEIRKKLKPEEMVALLKLMNRDYNIFENKIKEMNFYAAVLGTTEDTGESIKDMKMAEVLFEYFAGNQISKAIIMDRTPLCTWCYKKNFRFGVELILNNADYARRLQIYNKYDEANNGKLLIDYFRENNETEYIKRYYALFPEENPENRNSR